MKNPSTLTAIALATTFVFQAALAQATDMNSVTADKVATPPEHTMRYSDRQRMMPWSGDREKLAQALTLGASKADYKKIIADNGFTITAINKDKPDYVEYEVVKDSHSYEVQIDLDKKTRMGIKVDVESNLWRADATKSALRSGRAVAATKALSNADTYSDRAYREEWTSAKGRLENSMPIGKGLAYYTGELEKMGYQITSTNDKEKDYVEMEIVKGRDSYEIQIDLDASGNASKIGVTSNMWQTEATEKALASNKK